MTCFQYTYVRPAILYDGNEIQYSQYSCSYRNWKTSVWLRFL